MFSTKQLAKGLVYKKGIFSTHLLKTEFSTCETLVIIQTSGLLSSSAAQLKGGLLESSSFECIGEL
jgi:hypothetical protein